MSEYIPGKDDLLGARARISQYIHRTPVLTSRLINERAGAELFFKCENLQRMGAFKIRGALNAILSLDEKERAKGVLTHSSGNFAQAVSLSGQLLGIDAHIVMPQNAPAVKKAAVRGYQGNIIESGNSPEEREQKAAEVRASTDGTFVHPSDDVDVILGNSTSCQELLEECPDLDFVMAPVGGGGLVAGTALAAQYFGNDVQVVGAEPSGADDAFRSLRDGVIYPSENPRTICDGLRTYLGHHNFPIIRKFVSGIIRVDDDDTIDALRLIWERMKIIVEPSSAIVLAAVLKNPEKFAGKQVGLVISGGNVDLKSVCSLWEPRCVFPVGDRN